MTHVERKPRTDADLRQEGIVLLKNSIKAKSIAVDTVEAFINNRNSTADKNWGCYMLQQSVELALKGLIKYYCEDFREGHAVLYNAKLLIDMAGAHSELREIDDVLSQFDERLSSVLYKWQSLARYKDLWVRINDVELVDTLTDSICQFIRRHDYLNAE